MKWMCSWRFISPFIVLFGGCAETDSPLPEDVSTPDPMECEPFGLVFAQEWVDPDLPERGDRSGTVPGGAVGDLDGDGDPDILVAYGAGAFVLSNDGAGTFTVDEGMDLDGTPMPPAVSVALADLDGDGDLDGWLGAAKGALDRLIVNDGSGRFTSIVLEGSDVTPGSGSFADFDGDGDLDLFVSGFVDSLDLFAVLDGSQVGEGTALWIQESDGTFVDETERLPSESLDAICFQGTVLDADSDGDLDIYMGNDIGAAVPPNQLLLNDGDAGFTVSDDCSCELAMASMGSGMGDANHDGHPDVFISDVGPPSLLLGMGDGTFFDAAAAMGAAVPNTPDHSTGWGTAFADLNQDTCMDLIVLYGECCSSTELYVDSEVQYDQILLGDCAGGFVRDDPFSPTFENPDRSRSVVVGDLNDDLRPDLVVIGKHFVRTWLNDGGCPGGLGVRLDAGKGNRQGIGARVDVDVGGWITTQWMLPDTASSTSEHALYFGLGGAWKADVVTVTWPDGIVEVHESVDAGSTLSLEH